jgi:AraC-like DNA-binding protein
MGKSAVALPDAAAAQGPEGAVATIRFSTAASDAPFAAWRALLLALFDTALSKTSSTACFRADLTARHFGTFLLCKSTADAGRYDRGLPRLASDDLDHILISCLLNGSIAINGGSVRRLRPGDVAAIDLSSPASFAMSAGEVLNLVIPRTSLPAAIAPIAPVPSRIFARNTAMGIFIRGMMETLWQASPYLDAVEARALGAYFPDLLGWCLGTAPATSAAAGKADLGRRVRRYVEENLSRPDLTSARLTREIGVSRSQLYRQFEASGGVETYIRQRRLRRSLQALSDPRRADLRIGDIAYEVGFADEAHFSRLFRQAFGQSPRQIRAATGRGSHPRLADASFASTGRRSLEDWLLTLGTD